MTDTVQYQRIAELPGLVLGQGQFAQHRFEQHYHLDWHIGLVAAGTQRQRFGGASGLLAPGGIALMPPGQMHDGEGEAYTLQTFRVAPALLDDGFADLTEGRTLPGLAGRIIEAPALAQRLQSLFCTLGQSEQRSALAVQGEWLMALQALLEQTRVTRPVADSMSLGPAQWTRVRDYCEAHLAGKISLDDLADLCGLGRFQFLRQFKQGMGMTPHAWLLRLRLERACHLLAMGTRRVADVAQDVGFYDQSHFNRAFRKAFGVAPSAYG